MNDQCAARIAPRGRWQWARRCRRPATCTRGEVRLCLQHARIEDAHARGER